MLSRIDELLYLLRNVGVSQIHRPRRVRNQIIVVDAPVADLPFPIYLQEFVFVCSLSHDLLATRRRNRDNRGGASFGPIVAYLVMVSKGHVTRSHHTSMGLSVLTKSSVTAHHVPNELKRAIRSKALRPSIGILRIDGL